MAGCFHWHALGWGFPIPVQLQCVNSEGSWEDPVTWSGGERDDGRNHLFAEVSLFISNFLMNLHGRTLRLARLKELQSTLHWSVFMGFLQTPKQAQAQPLLWGLSSLLHLSCMWVNASWRGFGEFGQDDGGGSLSSALAPSQIRSASSDTGTPAQAVGQL